MNESNSNSSSTNDNEKAIMQLILCSSVAKCEENARLQPSDDDTAEKTFEDDIKRLCHYM